MHLQQTLLLASHRSSLAPVARREHGAEPAQGDGGAPKAFPLFVFTAPTRALHGMPTRHLHPCEACGAFRASPAASPTLRRRPRAGQREPAAGRRGPPCQRPPPAGHTVYKHQVHCEGPSHGQANGNSEGCERQGAAAARTGAVWSFSRHGVYRSKYQPQLRVYFGSRLLQYTAIGSCTMRAAWLDSLVRLCVRWQQVKACRLNLSLKYSQCRWRPAG